MRLKEDFLWMSWRNKNESEGGKKPQSGTYLLHSPLGEPGGHGVHPQTPTPAALGLDQSEDDVTLVTQQREAEAAQRRLSAPAHAKSASTGGMRDYYVS